MSANDVIEPSEAHGVLLSSWPARKTESTVFASISKRSARSPGRMLIFYRLQMLPWASSVTLDTSKDLKNEYLQIPLTPVNRSFTGYQVEDSFSSV